MFMGAKNIANGRYEEKVSHKCMSSVPVAYAVTVSDVTEQSELTTQIFNWCTYSNFYLQRSTMV
jgi:hypothetical protein